MSDANINLLMVGEMSSDLPITAVRLRERMKEVGETQDGLAESIGATQGAISQILTGNSRNSRLLPRIAQSLAVNLNWLTGATDEKIDMFNRAGQQIDEDQLAAMASGTAPVDLAKPTQLAVTDGAIGADPTQIAEIDVIDLAFGMGGAYLDSDSVEVDKMPFPLAWLRQYTSSPPHLLTMAHGIGDSMEPTISDRDSVLIDRGSTSLRDSTGERIWAAVFGGVGVIKRLRPMPNGTVKIMSDNPLVSDDVATDGELFIIGRVVGKSSRL